MAIDYQYCRPVLSTSNVTILPTSIVQGNIHDLVSSLINYVSTVPLLSGSIFIRFYYSNTAGTHFVSQFGRDSSYISLIKLK